MLWVTLIPSAWASLLVHPSTSERPSTAGCSSLGTVAWTEERNGLPPGSPCNPLQF